MYVSGPACKFSVSNLEASRRYLVSLDCCTSNHKDQPETVVRSPEVAFVTSKPEKIVKRAENPAPWYSVFMFWKRE